MWGRKVQSFSVWILEASNVGLSDGASLSGITQGDGSHLLGVQITLLNRNWLEVRVRDNDGTFDDNDNQQVLDGAQVIDGVAYADGRRVEAEYRVVVQAPDGTEYTLYGFNVNEPNPVTGNSFGTIEGLAFLGPPGGFPPDGVPLTVISTHEGPNFQGNPPVAYEDLASPICFTPGTRIAVPGGTVAVEGLQPGDLVLTRDRGPQPLAWVGSVRLSAARLAAEPALRPVTIRADSFGPGLPAHDLTVSPQHRILVRDARAELLFGTPEVLVAALHLVDGRRVVQPAPAAGAVYHHICFDRHEIVFAEGLEAESLRPGPAALRSVPAAARDELLRLFPELSAPGAALPAARPLLRRWEAAALRAPLPVPARPAA